MPSLTLDLSRGYVYQTVVLHHDAAVTEVRYGPPTPSAVKALWLCSMGSVGTQMSVSLTTRVRHYASRRSLVVVEVPAGNLT